jgi:hypothetical protein
MKNSLIESEEIENNKESLNNKKNKNKIEQEFYVEDALINDDNVQEFILNSSNQVNTDIPDFTNKFKNYWKITWELNRIKTLKKVKTVKNNPFKNCKSLQEWINIKNRLLEDYNMNKDLDLNSVDINHINIQDELGKMKFPDSSDTADLTAHNKKASDLIPKPPYYMPYPMTDDEVPVELRFKVSFLKIEDSIREKAIKCYDRPYHRSEVEADNKYRGFLEYVKSLQNNKDVDHDKFNQFLDYFKELYIESIMLDYYRDALCVRDGDKNDYIDMLVDALNRSTEENENNRRELNEKDAEIKELKSKLEN